MSGYAECFPDHRAAVLVGLTEGGNPAERMQLVSGRISIESQPGGGTSIRARVPFRSGIASGKSDNLTTAVSQTPC